MLSPFPQFQFFLIHLQQAFRNLLFVTKYIGFLPSLILFDLYAVFNIVDLFFLRTNPFLGFPDIMHSTLSSNLLKWSLFLTVSFVESLCCKIVIYKVPQVIAWISISSLYTSLGDIMHF